MGSTLRGMSKEYAVDQTGQLEKAHGIQCLLVDYGQDISTLNPPKGVPPDTSR
ncbi:MAG: hypothetical protein M2R45_02467 [Verrucomicrobia subdivision 3 bacterium]|nr:hypothetical protein [Limisphaerales bacterium]MCS1413255.1 hypothetical protein [Limisphaerales bacterium]